jgi:hypothetical protein
MLAHQSRRATAGLLPRWALASGGCALAPASPLAASSASASSSPGTAAPSPRRLGDILRLDMLADKTGAEVEAIWRDYHDVAGKKEAAGGGVPPPPAAFAGPAHPFRLGSALPAADYATFAARAAKAPLFALPISKAAAGSGEGAGAGGGAAGPEAPAPPPPPSLLTLVTQVQLPHVLVGTLEEYRGAGGPGAAPAHAVITHYDELAAGKGVVLVRTDVVSPAVLTPAEAAAALAALHRLYLDDAPGGGHALVTAFNNEPASFKWEALLEYLGLSGGSGGSGGGGAGGRG